jgi:hypothetical protein
VTDGLKLVFRSLVRLGLFGAIAFAMGVGSSLAVAWLLLGVFYGAIIGALRL